jgi:hypothetical protein
MTMCPEHKDRPHQGKLPQHHTRKVRGLRFRVLDARSQAVRHRIAAQVARLDPEDEREALAWNEAVSDFDSETSFD